MPFTHHHDMVKAFPSNRSNHALGIGGLPGRPWRNDRFPDVQRLSLTRKSFSIDLVSVTDQVPWSLLQPARLDQLPSGPPRRRMLGDIEMHLSFAKTPSGEQVVDLSALIQRRS
jgi:hypothetical protein